MDEEDVTVVMETLFDIRTAVYDMRDVLIWDDDEEDDAEEEEEDDS